MTTEYNTTTATLEQEDSEFIRFKVGTPLRELESRAIDLTLQHTGGNKNKAAEMLGIAPRTIYRYLARKQTLSA